MLGSAVSSSTPKDFQPNSHMGVLGSCPLMNRHAAPGPAMGCPYAAVGMQRALDSATGFPSRSTSASWMLVFLMPAEVRRNFMLPPGVITAGENGPEPALTDPYAVETDRAPKTHRPHPASRLQGTFRNTGPGGCFPGWGKMLECSQRNALYFGGLMRLTRPPIWR